MPRTVDIETFGEPHAVRLRVLRHRKKPVASRHTAHPKRLTQDRVRYKSAKGVEIAVRFGIHALRGLRTCHSIVMVRTGASTTGGINLMIEVSRVP